MKIGLFFGSFNPVHNGHLIIAKHIEQTNVVDQVWFIVSPQNPFKQSQSLLNENHRFKLLQLALEGETKLKASNIEFRLPRPSYTVDSLAYLSEKHPEHSFFLIMGSDGFQNILRWKNSEVIIENYQIIIYKRNGFEINNQTKASVLTTDAPFLDISSTHIRYLLKNNKSIRYLVPDIVKDEIEKQCYYYSELENPSE